MKTLEETLHHFKHTIDRDIIENYITRQWIQPTRQQETWVFEDIDIARVRLVYQLQNEMSVDEESMDIVLSLLDQLYGVRKQMRSLAHAIKQQPHLVQRQIYSFISEFEEDIS